MQEIVVFGMGMMAEVVIAHMVRDKAFRVAGATVDAQWMPSTTQATIAGETIPIVRFEEVTVTFPPDRYAMFVALGYHEMNQVRRHRCAAAREAGYKLVSYVSAFADVGPWLRLGDNCLVLDGVGIQPGTSLGNNVWVWNNSLIGHHTRIGDDCWIAAGTTIGGAASVGSGCFFGLDSTLGGAISVGDQCFFGARTLVTKPADDAQVFIDKDSALFRLDSKSFARMSRLHTIGSDS